MIALAAVGCSRSDERTYTLQGQIVALGSNHQEATIKHEEIKGLMPAMTMPYRVRDAKLLDGLTPGDLITAKLVIVSNDAYLVDVTKVGQAPLEQPAHPAESPSASSGFELLKPGEQVPDGTFVDENGRKRDFRSFQGRTVVLTFIYTRCPMPTFCPLMDRNFAAIQKKLKDEAMAGRVHLVSVSFDPLTDTPPVLKQHAKQLGADPAVWTFLTGNRDEIDQFAARFGVSVARAMNDQRDITHNLRTAIVDEEGKLVKVYTGNEWTPDQVLADVQKRVVHLF
jgi:protein SCO1/2